MIYNNFYRIVRRGSRTDNSYVYWTGEKWSGNPDDAVLFRRAETAEKYAESCGMHVLTPEDWIGGEMVAYVMRATPALSPGAVHF